MSILTKLIFVRHGVTPENLQHVMIGHTNPPLHPYGVLQAKAVAQALQTANLGVVISSPLTRAVQTAEPIARCCHLPGPAIASELTEIHLGTVEGVSSIEAYEQYRDLFDRALDDTLPDFRFPDGESRVEACRRFESGIQAFAEHSQVENVCIVTHGGVLGLWLAKLHGEPLGRFRSWQPPHASITTVTYDSGTFRLSSHGVTSHIPSELTDRIREARERMP